MNEIVKYNNQMNALTFKGFGKVDMNLLMALCSQMKFHKTDRIVMKFEDIKILANYTSTDGKDFVEDLERMSDRLMKVNSRIITDGKIAKFVLFPTFIIDPEEETLTIAVNQDFAFLLNELEQYTVFELAEFVGLNSKYAKNLYRLLKQWRMQGWYKFHDLEEFRKLMDIPTSYTNKYMMEKCVNVAIKEISELDKSFKGFKCEPEYARKRGKPLEKLYFTWQCEEIPKTNQSSDDQLEGQQGFTDPQSMDAYIQDYESNETSTKQISNGQNEDIDKIIQMMEEHEISRLNAQKIYDSAKGDMYHITKIYEYAKTQNINNLVGYMISMVRPDVFDEPKKLVKKTGFCNFDERKYSQEWFKNLESKIFE